MPKSGSSSANKPPATQVQRVASAGSKANNGPGARSKGNAGLASGFKNSKENDEKLRADLKGLKLGPLKKKAEDEQINKVEVEKTIDDADDPLQAMVQLIVNARKAKEAKLLEESGKPREHFAAVKKVATPLASPTDGALSVSSVPVVPQTSSTPVEEDALAIGSQVRLHSLTAVELNDKVGVVVSDPGVFARGRVPVQLADGRQVNVRQENVLVVTSKQAPCRTRLKSDDMAGATAASSSRAKRPRQTAGPAPVSSTAVSASAPQSDNHDSCFVNSSNKSPSPKAEPRRGKGRAKAPAQAKSGVQTDVSAQGSAGPSATAKCMSQVGIGKIGKAAGNPPSRSGVKQVQKAVASAEVVEVTDRGTDALRKEGSGGLKRKGVEGSIAQPASSETTQERVVRRRVSGKTTSEAANVVNVALMLKKLAEEDESTVDDNQRKKGETSKASGSKRAEAAAAAEAAEIEAMGRCGENPELEGEEGGRRRKMDGGAQSRRKHGEEPLDDDKLFDDEMDDLEGEEAISDLSDIGDMEDDEDDDDEAWVPVNALPYPKVWTVGASSPQPGQEGFNAYAAACIAKARLGTPDSPFAGLGLRLHQESAGFLLHPESPIRRLLVDHATGTGKTLVILRILENYFDDPRPKVAIFPKDRVCDNFYTELLKWPTRWRDYFSACRPEQASLASGAVNWKRKRSEMWDLNNERLRAEAKKRSIRLEKVVRELIDGVREALEMKNSIRQGKLKPGYGKKFRKENPGVPVPRAPLRAFRYTTAGGGACELGQDGWPRSPILKVGFDKKELNPYSSKVVVMDECHNLSRPTAKYEEQLGRLREHLNSCKNSVVAGFTGTPVGDQVEFYVMVSVEEGTKLGLALEDSQPGDNMLFVRDVERESLIEDWNVQNPRAQVKSGDVVVAVNGLRGVPAERLRQGLATTTDLRITCQRQEGRLLLDVMKGKAALHCNDEGFVSSFHARDSSDFPREIPVKGIPDGVIHEGMFEELVKTHSLHGEALKRYILKETEFSVSPRLQRLPEEKRMARLANYCNMHVHYGSYFGAHKQNMLQDVKDHAPKMHAIAKAVAKNKEKAVVLLTREMGFKAMLEVLRRTGKKHNFKVATMDELSDFNDAKRNLRGERFRVMLAETSQAGEGIQFRNVRRIHLIDVPLRHSDLVQRTSRCVRLGGHSALPPEERILAIELHVAQLPKFLGHGTGSLIYRELLNAKDAIATPGQALENATRACLGELKKLNVKTLLDLQREVQQEVRCSKGHVCRDIDKEKQKEESQCAVCKNVGKTAYRCKECDWDACDTCGTPKDGKKLINLLTETVLEHVCGMSTTPARPLGIALWRLRRGDRGDDIERLETLLEKQARTADEIILDWLVDKSAEILAPLEAMRLGAVDRELLKVLGEPPKAPPPRSEATQKKREKALRQLKPDVREAGPAAKEGEEEDAGGIQLDDEGNEVEDDLAEATLADLQALENEYLDDGNDEEEDDFELGDGEGEEEEAGDGEPEEES